MRLVVHGASLGAGTERMRAAAAGLAWRGHRVFWVGGDPPRAQARIPADVEIARVGLGAVAASLAPAQVVLGGPRSPLGSAALAWLSRARAVVLAMERRALAGWGPLDHWGWHSVYAFGLVDAADAEALRDEPHDLDPQRLALWSEQPPAASPDAVHPDCEILERACERSLVRAHRRSLAPAVFLDRDGTLVREVGYLSEPDQVELLPGVPAALHELRAAGFALVVVSNQSGVARGLFPLERVHQVHARLRWLLERHGVTIDAIYFCTHHPDEQCPCRKPRPGMLERAAEDLLLDLRSSFVVGDKRLDAETAHAARARGVLVRSGYGREEEQRAAADGGRGPDHVADGLEGAAEWILRQVGD